MKSPPPLSERADRIATQLGRHADQARSYVHQRRKARVAGLVGGTVAVAVGMGWLLPYVADAGFGRGPNLLSVVSTYLSLTGVAAVVAGLWMWQRYVDAWLRTSLGRLKAVVRHASQTLEHGDLHATDRLILHVQLSDAEEVLEEGTKLVDPSPLSDVSTDGPELPDHGKEEEDYSSVRP